MRRLIAGFLICALGYPLMLLLADGRNSLGVARLAAGFTLTGAVAIGVPLFYALRYRGWWTLWHFLLAGAAAGGIVSFPYMATGFTGTLLFTPLFAAMGMVHAALFWAVAIWNNDELRPMMQGAEAGPTVDTPAPDAAGAASAGHPIDDATPQAQ